MKEQQYKLQLADEYYNKALQKFHEGKLDDAEEIAIRAKGIYEQLGNKKKMALTLNIMSFIYSEMGNEALELNSLLDALEISIDANAYEIAAKLYNNFGSKLMGTKEYHRALYYFKLALEMFDKADREGLNNEEDRHTFILVLNMNMAVVYCEFGDIEKARRHYEAAKLESTHPLNEELFFSFQAFEGLILWKIGEKDKARECIEPILQNAENNHFISDYMEVISDFIQLLKEIGDIDRWKEVLMLMDRRLNENNGMGVRIELTTHWINYFKTIGDYESYKNYCIQYFELAEQKKVQEYVQKANSIELGAEIRRTVRQKRHSDAIVYLDPLTGIGNRNRMVEDSKKYIVESVKDRSLITIGVIDVDFFKECNDTYGHIKGDECLKAVAKIIKEAIGKFGNVYRYGGDEFLVLLKGTKEDDINQIGKRIKDKLEEVNIPNSQSPVKPYVTVSQGYTQAIPDEGDTIDQLVNLADKVLYLVKRNGRNDYLYMHFDDVIKEIKSEKEKAEKNTK